MHDNTNIYWVSVKPRLRHFLASETFFMQVKILRLYWAMVMILAAWSALDTSSSVLDSSLRILPRHAVKPGSTWPSTCTTNRSEQSDYENRWIVCRLKVKLPQRIMDTHT